MEIDVKALKMIADTGRVICDVPKVSVMFSTDEMFRLYLYGFNRKEIMSIENFFTVYRQHNLMTDELKTKLDIFNEVIEDKIRREKIKNSPYYPNRITKVKKPDELNEYSAKDLGRIFRWYSFQSYLDVRKPKLSKNDFGYLMGKWGKKGLDSFNRIMNMDI